MGNLKQYIYIYPAKDYEKKILTTVKTPIIVQNLPALCEIACAMVPILPRTNPYSFEKRKYGGISGSGHAACTLSIRTRILPESNFFRGMEYPMSGHVIETQRVRTCKRPYFSRHAENHGVPLMNATLFASHFLQNSTLRIVLCYYILQTFTKREDSIP